MATIGYTKIDAIPGECAVSGYEDQIPILDYDYEISQPTAGGGGPKANVPGGIGQHSPLVIFKGISKASPKLAEYASSGANLETVTVTLVRQTGAQEAYMVYTLENTHIEKMTSLKTEEKNALFPDVNVPVEKIWLRASKIVRKYTEFDTAGASVGDVEAGFDYDVGTTT